MRKKLHADLAGTRATIAELSAVLSAAPRRPRADVLVLVEREADRLQALIDKAAQQALEIAQAGRALVLEFDRLPPGAVMLASMGRKAFTAALLRQAETLPLGLTADERATLNEQLEEASHEEVRIMRALEASGQPVAPRPDADPRYDLEHANGA